MARREPVRKFKKADVRSIVAKADDKGRDRVEFLASWLHVDEDRARDLIAALDDPGRRTG